MRAAEGGAAGGARPPGRLRAGRGSEREGPQQAPQGRGSPVLLGHGPPPAHGTQRAASTPGPTGQHVRHGYGALETGQLAPVVVAVSPSPSLVSGAATLRSENDVLQGPGLQALREPAHTAEPSPEDALRSPVQRQETGGRRRHAC